MNEKGAAVSPSFEGRVLLKNISLTSLAMAFRVVIAAGSLGLISRMASPTVMGLYGIGWVAASFGYAISQSGAAQAIIGMEKLEREHISAAQALSLIIAVSAAGIVVISIPFLSKLYSSTKVEYAFFLGALSIPSMTLGAVDIARGQKELQFSRLAVIQTLGMLLSAISALLLAWFGFTIEGLFALQGLVGIYVFLIARFYWHSPGFGGFKWRHVTDVWQIGMHLSLGSLTAVIWQNIPQLVLARAVTLDEVGLYTFCSRIVQLVFGLLSGMVNTVIYPTFAKLQADPTQIGKAFLNTVRFTYFCVMLPMLCIAAAPSMFLLVYGGSQWSGAGGILFFLVLSQMGLALGANVFPTFAALGRPSYVWRWNIQIALVQGVFTAIFAPYGPVAVAQGLAMTSLIMPLAVYRLSRVAHFQILDYARSMAIVVTATVPALIIGSKVQDIPSLTPLARVGLSAISASLLYTVIVVMLDTQFRALARATWLYMRGKGKAVV